MYFFQRYSVYKFTVRSLILELHFNSFQVTKSQNLLLKIYVAFICFILMTAYFHTSCSLVFPFSYCKITILEIFVKVIVLVIEKYFI